MAEAAAATTSPRDDAGELCAAAERFAALAERALANRGATGIASADLEHVLTAAIKLYAAKAEAEATLPPPISAAKITPTEVVMVVSEMLRAADLSLFDLAMWYRRPR